jgi:hypothetical protein
MADVNVTGQGTFAANSYTVPNPTVNVSTVSFHTASQNCKICFGNSTTFGMSSFNVNTGPAQSLPLKGVVGTSFSVVGQNNDCTAGRITDTDYTITMGGGMPGGKK